MKVTFHDIGRTVDVPDGSDESAIDDIHDSVLKDYTSGNIAPIPHPNSFLDAITRAVGQGAEAANTGSVPFTLRDESPYWKKAGDVADATNFQAANGMAAGIPGAVMSALGQKTPSSGNPILDASLSTAGGMVGLPGAAGNVAAQGIGNPLLRGAMRGAGFMGAMPGDLKQRAGGAAIGALFGAPTELAGDLAVKGVKAAAGLPAFLKDVFTSGGKLADVNEGLASTGDQLANINAPKQTSYGPLTESQGTQLGQRVLNKAQGSMTGEVQDAGDKIAGNMAENYKAQKADLAGKFNKATESETGAYKTAMDDAAAQNTPLYGQRLDELQGNLKEPITPDEYNKKVIQPALQEIAQKRLPLGGPEATIKSWAQKFSPVENAAEEIPKTNDLGLPVESAPPQPAEPITLRGLNNIKNDVYNSQSYGSRMGSAKPDPSDVAANIFQKYHSDFMNTRVPGHAELQADAGPMIESTRNVFKAIRPGEEDLQPGMNMLQKAAKGQANPAKANPDIARDLGRVEQGHGGFQGTGNLRGQSTKIAQDMRDLDLKFTGNKEDLIAQIDKKTKEIADSFAQDSSTIKRGGMENRENMLQRQGVLTQRKASLENSQKDLIKLKGIRDWAAGSAATAIGLDSLYHGGKKIFGG